MRSAASLSFGPNTRQNNAWWYFGGGAEAMAPLFKEYGCIAMLAGNTGCQMGGWFRKEIKTVEDLRGLKFRIGGMAGLVLAKLGVVPQMIGGPDIYPALEKGTIDGAEWVGPYDDEKLGFNKVAQYYYYPGWWEGGPMLTVLDQREEVAGAAQELPGCTQGRMRRSQQSGCRRSTTRRTRRLCGGWWRAAPSCGHFPKVVMEACEKAAYEVYDELSAKSAHFKRIYPQWKKFRDEQFLWFRVAESSYDNYSFYSQIGQEVADLRRRQMTRPRLARGLVFLSATSIP